MKYESMKCLAIVSILYILQWLNIVVVDDDYDGSWNVYLELIVTFNLIKNKKTLIKSWSRWTVIQLNLVIRSYEIVCT